MLGKALSLVVVLCFWIQVPAIVAQSSGTQISKEAKHAEKIKRSVFRSAVGPGNDIEVKLRDKTKLSGYLSEITDDYFVVTDPRTGVKTTLEYGQVDKVRLWLPAQNALKRKFRSSGTIIRNLVIGIALGVTAIGIICAAAHRCEQ
jgi:hypothetical protein